MPKTDPSERHIVHIRICATSHRMHISFTVSLLSWALDLIIPSSLLIRWRWSIICAIARSGLRRGRRRLHISRCWARLRFRLLLRELRVRCAGVHGSIALLSLLWCCVLWLAGCLNIVVCDCAALGVLLRDLLVGWVGRDGDDVPGVEEAGEVC